MKRKKIIPVIVATTTSTRKEKNIRGHFHQYRWFSLHLSTLSILAALVATFPSFHCYGPYGAHCRVLEFHHAWTHSYTKMFFFLILFSKSCMINLKPMCSQLSKRLSMVLIYKISWRHLSCIRSSKLFKYNSTVKLIYRNFLHQSILNIPITNFISWSFLLKITFIKFAFWFQTAYMPLAS